MFLRVVDLETTGSAPPAEIVEMGLCDVHVAGQVSCSGPVSRLYRPLNGIPPEVIAVHHLTEEHIGAEAPVCSVEEARSFIMDQGPPDALVAHNCAFEQSFLSKEVTGGTPWICTYKVALRVWADAPGFSNQVLRYWRGHRLDPDLAMPPHRAGPDAFVTAQLLRELLSEVSPQEMAQWSSEPCFYPRIRFGKHKGAAWADIPSDYLQWMIGQGTMESDVRWCAERELTRRG